MMTSIPLTWFYWRVYQDALNAATDNRPALFSSRIDGAILPFDGYRDELWLNGTE